jgi:Cu+-exporting ATPase
VEVLRPFEQSSLKRLWEEFRRNDTARPTMPRTIDAVARRFTVAVLVIATGAGIYWWGHDPRQVWPVVTAVLIVACPCALALSMPFAYGHVIRLLGRRGLFLRDAEVVERLSRIDTVVFDKTGTLTAREAFDVSFDGVELTAQERTMVRSLARSSIHPLSAAVHHALDAPVKELAFVEEHAGQGIEGIFHGVPVRLGSAAFCNAGPAPIVAGEAVVHVSVGSVPRGLFRLRKKSREGMVEAVERLSACRPAHLFTGDATVSPQLVKAFGPAQVRAGMTPAGKADAVAELQRGGGTVLMVGDGLNDSGALLQSDVGITVTESSAAFTPSSDAIMDARSLHRLPDMLRLTRVAHRIVIASLGISLLYNITGVSFAVAGHLTPLVAAILMPLSSVSVVGFVSLAVWLAYRRSEAGKDDDRHVKG